MSDFMLKQAEGSAHANANELGIDVDTTRQINNRTDCLIIDYSLPAGISKTRKNRKRAFFVRALNRADGSMTGLDDGRIIMTDWR